jgi:hypothetical protein
MKKLLTFFAILITGSVFAQNDTVFTIDLGKEKTIEYDVKLDKNFRIGINNIVPSKNYQISYEFKKNENVDNLGKLLMENATGLDLMKLIDPSRGASIETFQNALDTLTDESQVSVVTDKVEEAIANPKTDSITKAELMALKESVEKEYDKIFKVKKPDEDLVITITRTDLTSSEESWQITIKPERIGEFKITYGFAVISPVLNSYDKYEYEYAGNNEYFVVSRGKPEWNEFIYNPTVDVVWYRNKARSLYGISTFNPTVGFGLALLSSESSGILNPSIFMGFSFSVQRAINFSVGIAMHQYKTLDDAIDVTKTYDSDFIFDTELMTKNVYAFNPAFSITFNINGGSGSEY